MENIKAKKQRASHTKDVSKDTEMTRKKRELTLEAVRGAGFPSFPLNLKNFAVRTGIGFQYFHTINKQLINSAVHSLAFKRDYCLAAHWQLSTVPPTRSMDSWSLNLQKQVLLF